jgi:hypothetical protein
VAPAFAKMTAVVMGPGSRPGRHRFCFVFAPFTPAD